MVIFASRRNSRMSWRGSVRLPPNDPSGALITVSVIFTPACSASLASSAGLPLKEAFTHHISTYLNPISAAFLIRDSKGICSRAISRHRPIFIFTLLQSRSLQQMVEDLVDASGDRVTILLGVIVVDFNVHGAA